MEVMVDALRGGEIVTVSEREALEDDLFILRKHEEKAAVTNTVSGTNSELVRKQPIKWKSYEAEYKKNNVVKELIDNFHWNIIKGRKSMNLSRKQVCQSIGASEAEMRMLENGELPSDDFVLINKLQTFLKINLRRDGRTFDAPMRPKADPGEVTLASLQKAKENKVEDRKVDRTEIRASNVLEEIEIID